jgi:hypothetical protein
MSNRFAFLTLLVLSAAVAGAAPGPAQAADELPQNSAEAQAEPTDARYQLQYKYRPGETISYSIEHLVAIDTTIAGNNQKTKLRTKSTRSLQVEDVAANGNMRFVHVVDHVDMWSEVAGREAVHYASDQSDPPPPEYAHVAETVGKPISVITIDPRGQIVDRQDKVQHPDLGLGGITVPLPAEAAAIGHSWSQPLELKVRLEDNRIKAIQTRELYRLEKVETGIATISIQTQVLTPVDDPRVKAQIIQRISKGEIRFDIDAGRLVSKRLEWDEAVLGFNGAQSNMKYLAQFNEQLDSSRRTAQQPSTKTAS